MYWPGSEVAIQDMRPTACYNYDESVPFKDRVNEIMGYFNADPEQYPALVTFYLHEPDGSGHRSGPYGDWLTANLSDVDHIINMLLSGLEQKSLDNCVNIVIVSDHGMDSIDCDRTIDLAPYFDTMLDELHFYDEEQVRITSQFIYEDGHFVETPGGATADEILDKVKCKYYNDTKDWYVRFDKKEDLPKRFHYSNNIRIEEVIGEVQTQFLAFRNASDDGLQCTGGAHGFDPAYGSMHAIFLGAGPSFKSSIETEPVENIEVYNLVADLLHLDNRAPTNGTSGSLHYLLSTSTPLPERPPVDGVYGSCPYPVDEHEASLRRNSTETCNWVDIKNFTTTPIADIDGQLNLSTSAVSQSVRDHVPLGVPEVDFSDATLCQLTQRSYVIGYSDQHHMPLWAAFKLTKNASCSLPDSSCFGSDDALPDLIRPDVRLNTDTQPECDLYTNDTENINGHFLFPPGLINATTNPDQVFDGHISTNVVPMYDQFRTGVWQELLYLLEEYTYKYGDLRVMAGPIFDYNADGKRDSLDEIKMYVSNGVIPLPTHYYMIAFRCKHVNDYPGNCTSDIAVLSVILRHRADVTNCWERRYVDYIEKNVARVRDIELLTGLRFHPNITEVERLRISVFLSEALWDRMSWMDLRGSGDEECPTLGDSHNCPTGYDASHPPLLLISVDGLRPDYLERGVTPVMKKLRDCGSHADYMRSIYPTLTFPNHFSLITGLYPESHGIVDNNMYDMELREAFSLGSETSYHPEWWTGEPFWNTVEKQNKTAMTLFWPGSDVEIGGLRPTSYFVYTSYMPHSLRVSTVLEWLEKGASGKLPNFVTLYFSSVDSAGHEGGPDSLMVNEALIGVDLAMKQLIDGIYRMQLHQCINIIITSDHGMADISCDWNVILNDYINMDLLDNKTYLYPGSAARMSNKYYRDSNYVYHHIEPEQQVPKEQIIKNLTCDSRFMNVFDKVDMPKRHHYANNHRIDDILFVAADSWSINEFNPWCPILGNHGWDPYYESMKAYFSAYGPGFKEKLKVDAFENIELYNLMSYLVGVEPSANNGTEGSLHHILKDPPILEQVVSVPYTDCEYPENESVYDRRADLVTSECSCTPPDNYTIKLADERLNFDPASQLEKETEHIPHGLPSIQDEDVCVLHHDKFVSGYSRSRKISLWTAFSIQFAPVMGDIQIDCLRPDVRMEQSEQPSCADFNANDVTNGFLYPPEWLQDEDQMDALILSNAVPMYKSFWSGIWLRLLNKMRLWAAEYGTLHTVLGPIYDFDADGLADKNITSDIPHIPSHYYAILLKCPTANCSTDMSYDALSFIISHKPNITNCATEDSYLMDNVARIRDIELLTNLEFLTNVTSSAAVRTRTFIPTSLWPLSGNKKYASRMWSI